MAIDDFDFEPSDPDEWEDYDPERDDELDEDFDGFEVFESQDDYLLKHGYYDPDDDEDPDA